jgi:hypothetical protein
MKKNLLPKATTCVYQKLIINEENFVLINPVQFLAIKKCLPASYLNVLGYVNDKNKDVVYLFNLFKNIQNGFFVLEDGRSINIDEPIVLYVYSISNLLGLRKLFFDTDLFCFNDRCLYKIAIRDLIPYLTSYNKCGELTNKQIIR